MNQKLREWFSFTRGERVSLMILLACVLLVLMIRWISQVFPARAVTLDMDDTVLREFLATLEEEPGTPDDGKTGVLRAYDTLVLFPFDPNEVSAGQLSLLGFTGRQAQTLLHYREAGGHFTRSEDLKKIYGLYEEQYLILEDFIRLPEDASPVSPDKKKTPERDTMMLWLELNSCDSVDLLSLPAIGPVFAGRITRYRDLLGGYVEIQQLMEVYGMDKERLDRIMAFLYVDTMKIMKINLNTCQFSELLRHPYLDYSQTTAIMKYRDLAGTIHDGRELLVNRLISAGTYRKIRPYLATE